MLSFEEIQSDLKAKMKPKRFEHVMGVVDTAEKLAEFYGEDIEKARLAALLHDAAKLISLNEDKMRVLAARTQFADEYPEDLHGEELFHAHAGEVLAYERYGVTDTDILSAVHYHTTGKADMTPLELMIYSADMVEPTRNFPGVENLRGLMFTGLERLALGCMGHTIEYLRNNNKSVHRTSVEAYNYLKNKENGE